MGRRFDKEHDVTHKQIDRINKLVTSLRKDANEQKELRAQEVVDIRKEIKNSIAKAKKELNSQFEAMLHENTVEVDEEAGAADAADVGSDLLSS